MIDIIGLVHNHYEVAWDYCLEQDACLPDESTCCFVIGDNRWYIKRSYVNHTPSDSLPEVICESPHRGVSSGGWTYSYSCSGKRRTRACVI